MRSIKVSAFAISILVAAFAADARADGKHYSFDNVKITSKRDGGQVNIVKFGIDDSKCVLIDSFEPTEMRGTTRHGSHDVQENPSTTYCTLKSETGKKLTLAFEEFVPRNVIYETGHAVQVRVVESTVYSEQAMTWKISSVKPAD